MHEWKETCPYCQHPECMAEFVHNGVGMQQCGPFECEKCGAYQVNPYHDDTNLTVLEQQTGWYAPTKPGDAT